MGCAARTIAPRHLIHRSLAVLCVTGALLLGGQAADELCVTKGATVSDEAEGVVSVLATLSFPVEAVQFTLCHDPVQLAAQGVATSGTDVAALNGGAGPDFLETPIDEGLVGFFMVVGYPTPTPEALRPGDRTLAHVTYRKAPTATPGATPLSFCSDLALAALSDEEGNETLPATCEGNVLVVGDGPDLDHLPFVRGDAQPDGTLNVSDVRRIVLRVFLGTGPDCETAYDCNDDGRVNVADAIYLAGALFVNSQPLLGPFPECGYDQTPDTLTCRQYARCSR